MKKILVPCDFSKQAINAYRTALEIASNSRGVIYVLNIIELPALHNSKFNFQEGLFKELKEKAEIEFKKIRNKYEPDGIKVVFDVRFGSVVHTIEEYTKELDIDIVMLGSHGASGIREFLIGSNAEKVVRNSTVPVLVLKHYFKGPIKNIVFPNNLDTEKQEDLVMKVKALQNFFKAHLRIVWINTPLHFVSDPVTYERLTKFVKRFMLKDYSLHVFNHFDEEQGILQFAQQTRGNLIAMGTHGRKGLDHLLSGSVAEDVVNHTENMVWTYSLNSGAKK